MKIVQKLAHLYVIDSDRASIIVHIDGIAI